MSPMSGPRMDWGVSSRHSNRTPLNVLILSNECSMLEMLHFRRSSDAYAVTSPTADKFPPHTPSLVVKFQYIGHCPLIVEGDVASLAPRSM